MYRFDVNEAIVKSFVDDSLEPLEGHDVSSLHIGCARFVLGALVCTKHELPRYLLAFLFCK